MIKFRDTNGTARKAASSIAKRHDYRNRQDDPDLSAAIRYALGFTDAAERTVKPPLNYQSCTLEELRTLVSFGYDHFTRSHALAEIERRYKSTLAGAQS